MTDISGPALRSVSNLQGIYITHSRASQHVRANSISLDQAQCRMQPRDLPPAPQLP